MLPHSRGATASPGATSCQRGPSRARLRRDELPPTCGKRLRADPGRLSAKSSEAAVAFCQTAEPIAQGARASAVVEAPRMRRHVSLWWDGLAMWSRRSTKSFLAWHTCSPRARSR